MNSVCGTDSFEVLETTGGLQTAAMRLEHGQESGPLGNEHPASPQALVVFQGAVDGEIDGRSFRLNAGESVIVPKGAAHRFVGASTEPAITFNVYAPPAY